MLTKSHGKFQVTFIKLRYTDLLQIIGNISTQVKKEMFTPYIQLIKDVIYYETLLTSQIFCFH